MNAAMQYQLQRFGQRVASRSLLSGAFLQMSSVSGTATGAYAGWVIADSWSTSLSPGFADEMTLIGRGKTGPKKVTTLYFTKPSDRVSPHLSLLYSTGRPLDRVVLDVVSKGQRAFRFTMKEVYVSSFAMSVAIEGKGTDAFSLNFKEAEFTRG